MFSKTLLLFFVLVGTIFAAPSINIINTDTSNYPYVDVTYFSSSELNPHGASNVKVYRDSKPIGISAFSGSSTVAANIVLVMDVSGSMSSSRTLYPENKRLGYAQRAAIEFAKGLSDSSGNFKNANITLVTFDSSTYVKLVNATTFKSVEKAITDLRPLGGTNTFDGAMKGLDFLKSVNGQKILIVFSDGATNGDYYTQTQVIATAKKYGISINTIALGSGATESNLKPMAVQTGGQYIKDDGKSSATNSTMTKAFNNIYATFKNAYTYRIKVPVENAGGRHELKTVLTKTRATYSAQAISVYYDPLQTKVTLSQNTWTRQSQSQVEYKSFLVEALVTTKNCELANSNPVKLVAKHNQSDWSNANIIPMRATTPCTPNKITTLKYTAYIPSNIMKRNGVQFYILTKDNKGFEATFPADSARYPIQIAVLPNKKPQISHKVITQALKNQAVHIKGIVIDKTVRVEYLKVFYRRSWEIGWTTLANKKVAKSTYNFDFTIPANKVAGSTIDYFIYAVDNFGAYSQVGSSSSPRRIKLIDVISDPTSNLNWMLKGTGDFDRDGLEELVWYNRLTGQVIAWEPGASNTNTLGQKSLPTITDKNWDIKAIADLNYDEYPDMILQNKVTGAVKINYMHKYSNIYVTALPKLAKSIQIIGIADVDNDGLKDIVIRDLVSGLNFIWYNLDNSIKSVKLPTLKMGNIDFQ